MRSKTHQEKLKVLRLFCSHCGAGVVMNSSPSYYRRRNLSTVCDKCEPIIARKESARLALMERKRRRLVARAISRYDDVHGVRTTSTFYVMGRYCHGYNAIEESKTYKSEWMLGYFTEGGCFIRQVLSSINTIESIISEFERLSEEKKRKAINEKEMMEKYGTLDDSVRDLFKRAEHNRIVSKFSEKNRKSRMFFRALAMSQAVGQ